MDKLIKHKEDIEISGGQMFAHSRHAKKAIMDATSEEKRQFIQIYGGKK